MYRSLFLILSILSGILYCFAPLDYSLIFCIFCVVIFFVEAFVIIRNDMRYINIVNFNLIFLFSFFVCTYVFPIFLVGSDSIIGDFLKASLYTLTTVNRCVSLSTLAISVYGLAYMTSRRINNFEDIEDAEIYKAVNIHGVVKPLVIIINISVFYMLLNFISQHANETAIEVNDSPYLFYFFYVFLSIDIVCISFQYKKNYNDFRIIKFFSTHKLFYASILLPILAFFFIGDRLPIVTIVFMFLGAIALFLKRINARYLALLGVFGVIILFSLRETRTGDHSLKSAGLSSFINSSQDAFSHIGSIWDVFSDLIGINYELNSGMYYVDHYGYLYPGANAVINLTAPLPFVPTLLTQLFYNKTPVEVSPGSTLSEFTNSAAGNHCVIDLYMPFGVIGVVLIFFIFGWFVARVSNKLYGNLFYSIFYVYLLGWALFIPRNSLTNMYRAFVLSYLIYIVLLCLKQNQNLKYKIKK